MVVPQFANKIRKLFWSLWLFILPITLYALIYNHVILIDWHVAPFITTFLSFPLIFDWINIVFASTVIFISAKVLQFSSSYIQHDPFFHRFTILIILFVLSINILIFFPNIITLLLGWDGLGFTSFILIVYYQNPKSLAAGILTALTNRIGDILILIRIGIIINQGHWNILRFIQTPSSYFILTLILIAALTKRAQIPFSRWLPAAIAAPTPVSALVHSSTLVTAGVFLVIRFHTPILETPYLSHILLITSSLTIVISGLAATTEYDLKKIIALSTLSQIGLIIGSLALGLFTITFFHLITHALFKALLFICAGNFIFYQSHCQDLRLIGNLINQIPVTSTCFLIANMALSGIPFLAGFYSKDIILENALQSPFNIITIILFILATRLTAIYSWRFISHIILSYKNSPPINNLENIDNNLKNRIISLTLGAITRGAILSWTIIIPVSEPIIPSTLTPIPLLVSVIGLYLLWVITEKHKKYTSSKHFLYNDFNSSIWFLTPISTQIPQKIFFSTSLSVVKTLDYGWLEKLFGHGINRLIKFLTQKTHLLHSAIITRYLLTSIIALIIIINFILYCVE